MSVVENYTQAKKFKKKLSWKKEPNEVIKSKSKLKYISLFFLQEAEYVPMEAYADILGIFSQDTNSFRNKNL